MSAYDVKCPKCGERATAEMQPHGTIGSYREVFVNFVACRLVSTVCGFNTTSDKPLPYELWYKVAVGGRWAWARNRSHAAFLVGYLSGSPSNGEVNSSSVETLPGWMLEPKNRALVVRRLRALLAGG